MRKNPFAAPFLEIIDQICPIKSTEADDDPVPYPFPFDPNLPGLIHFQVTEDDDDISINVYTPDSTRRLHSEFKFNFRLVISENFGTEPNGNGFTNLNDNFTNLNKSNLLNQFSFVLEISGLNFTDTSAFHTALFGDQANMRSAVRDLKMSNTDNLKNLFEHFLDLTRISIFTKLLNTPSIFECTPTGDLMALRMPNNVQLRGPFTQLIQTLLDSQEATYETTDNGSIHILKPLYVTKEELVGYLVEAMQKGKDNFLKAFQKKIIPIVEHAPRDPLAVDEGDPVDPLGTNELMKQFEQKGKTPLKNSTALSPLPSAQVTPLSEATGKVNFTGQTAEEISTAARQAREKGFRPGIVGGTDHKKGDETDGPDDNGEGPNNPEDGP